MDVLVLLPAPMDAPGLEGAAPRVVRYAGPDEATAALADGFDVAVICSDGLASDGLARLAAAVRESRRPCLEVRSSGWDGITQSPLSAACRGVVSGFGAGGLAAALHWAEGPQAK